MYVERKRDWWSGFSNKLTTSSLIFLFNRGEFLQYFFFLFSLHFLLFSLIVLFTSAAWCFHFPISDARNIIHPHPGTEWKRAQLCITLIYAQLMYIVCLAVPENRHLYSMDAGRRRRQRGAPRAEGAWLTNSRWYHLKAYREKKKTYERENNKKTESNK